MKKLILFTNLILLPLFVFAQTELTGALGLTFGMNKASVRKILIDKGGVFNASESNATALSFNSVTMGTELPDLVSCMFINDKLYTIFAVFIPPSKVNTQATFNRIEKIIESKYGEPKSTREFTLPYTDGEGEEASAVIAGKATIISSWKQFKNSSSIDLLIMAMNFDAVVVLYYTDGVLMKEVNAKDANDF